MGDASCDPTRQSKEAQATGQFYGLSHWDDLVLTWESEALFFAQVQGQKGFPFRFCPVGSSKWGQCDVGGVGTSCGPIHHHLMPQVGGPGPLLFSFLRLDQSYQTPGSILTWAPLLLLMIRICVGPDMLEGHGIKFTEGEEKVRWMGGGQVPWPVAWAASQAIEAVEGVWLRCLRLGDREAKQV